MHTLYTIMQHAPHSSRDHSSSTAHQFRCCVHRLKRSRTSPHSPGPQPGSLITSSGRDDAIHGCEPSSGVVDEVWLAALVPVYSYCSCCEPDFDLGLLESRHDALDSPSTSRLESIQRPRAARTETARAMVAVARFYRCTLFFVRVRSGYQ